VALYNEQWFIHGVSENVTFLAQQKKSKVMSAMRSKENVIGKTWPFNRIGATSMMQVARDAATVYLNPPQSKRRAVLVDFAAAVLIDEFDEVKTLTNPQSEHAQNIAYARNRTIDDQALAIAGLGVAGVAGTAVGGILGLATNVDEGAETTSTTALPSTQQIVNGGTGLTMAKLRNAVRILKSADIEFDAEEIYIAYSPAAASQLLADTTVTSSDFGTIQRLISGGFGTDEMWMGFKWRMSTRLPSAAANIRSLAVWAKSAVGYAAAGVKELQTGLDPGHWNNPFVIAKLSCGVVRIDDAGVVQIDIDESVAL
jgi:Phage capsid protein